MKIIKSLSLILLVMAVETTGVYAYDFEKDGIYYNILSEEDRTVEVTSPPLESDFYSGEIVVPQKIIYEGKTYAVTTIGYGAFADCGGLASVSMPTVTTISDYAFFFCESLVSVSMPLVTTAGEHSFYGCISLTSVEMPSTTMIGNSAFGDCFSLKSVSMPSVSTISDMAFDNCSGLTSVFIPASCTSIGSSPFSRCKALEGIVVDYNNPNYTSKGGVLYDKSLNTLIVCPNGLSSVDILPSVTMISDGAFYDGCLTSIVIPQSVKTIGDGAFQVCTALTSVDIPASVTTIGDRAFDGCIGLTSVYCHWEEPLECDSWFTDEVLMNATIYIPKGTMEAYSKVDPWRNFWNIKEME